MEKFEKLGLSNDLVKVLEECGFKEPSEIQEKAIPIALAGKDVVGGSATGSGKTLVFATPIVENLKPNKKVQALILTPTRELAEQVSTSIKKFSKGKQLKLLPIYGGVDIRNQIRKIPRTDLVVGTPGRILDHLERGTLSLNSINFLVLDEADRMFDMGFQKDVEKILNQCSKERQTMLFSATISNGLDYLVKKHCKNPVHISVESRVDASKLKQIYYDVPDRQKFSLLFHLLEKDKSSLSMVFCGTRRNVDFITKALSKNGINAKAIHGGLSQNRRSRMLEDFHAGKVNVLVCTDVAARGLDIKGVSHVYNYDIPKTSDDYIHRIGRTARAGKEGKAINILASRDYDNFNNVLQDKSIKVIPKELPEIKEIKIDFPKRGDSRRERGGQRRNSSKKRSRGKRNYGNSRRKSGNSSRRNNSGKKSNGRNFRKKNNQKDKRRWKR